MKKFLYFIVILFLVSLLISCKSKDVVYEEGILEEKSVDSVENQELSDKSDISDDKSAEDYEADNQGESDETLQEKEFADRGYIGWIDTGIKNPSFEEGLIRIKTNSRLGTFCVFAVDNSKKVHPILSSLNEYTSNSFYLKAGKKIFKLSANDKVDTIVSELEHGVRLLYDIKNIANVTVDMEVFPALKNKPADTLKFTVTVQNKGKRAETFALKTILDTVLGENGKFHFYNCEGIPVKNEVLYRSMKENKWFLSKNDKASMQILLDGGDVTPVEFVSLANYRTLEKASWMPFIQNLGTFDTVLSYNNSAVGVIWPEKRLAPKNSYKTTFYISVGLDGVIPNGYKYVYNIKTPEPEEEPEIINVFEGNKGESYEESYSQESDILTENEYIPDNESYNDSIGETEDIENVEDIGKILDIQDNLEETTENAGDTDVPENVEFNVKNISKDLVTTEYIQSLIDRIADLEKAGASVNRSEILQLNAELDAILSILR